MRVAFCCPLLSGYGLTEGMRLQRLHATRLPGADPVWAASMSCKCCGGWAHV